MNAETPQDRQVHARKPDRQGQLGFRLSRLRRRKSRRAQGRAARARSAPRRSTRCASDASRARARAPSGARELRRARRHRQGRLRRLRDRGGHAAFRRASRRTAAPTFAADVGHRAPGARSPRRRPCEGRLSRRHQAREHPRRRAEPREAHRPGASAAGARERRRSPPTWRPSNSATGRGEARTDLYQVGALVYHLVTGKAPFSGTREEVDPSRAAGAARGSVDVHCRSSHGSSTG